MKNYKTVLVAAGISLSVGTLANTCPKVTKADDAYYKKIVKDAKNARIKANKLTKEVEASGKISDLERLSELTDILEPLQLLKEIPLECREHYGVSQDGNNMACGNSAC